MVQSSAGRRINGRLHRETGHEDKEHLDITGKHLVNLDAT